MAEGGFDSNLQLMDRRGRGAEGAVAKAAGSLSDCSPVTRPFASLRTFVRRLDSGNRDSSGKQRCSVFLRFPFSSAWRVTNKMPSRLRTFIRLRNKMSENVPPLAADI